MGNHQSTDQFDSIAASTLERKDCEKIHEQNSGLFHHERFQDHYTVIRNLGQPGGFAYAQEVKHNATGEHRAAKVISKLTTKFRSNSTRREMFVREMEYLATLNHPNICRGFEAYEDEESIYLVMELCRGGELYDRLKELESKNEIYTEQAAANVIRQLCSAVAHMHANGVAHCDLKPDNFLFETPARDSPIKIIDFNLARHATPLHYFHSMRGTKFYMAPEVYEGHYTYHCDMWSLGTVTFLMLFGYPPFFGENDREVEAETMRGFSNEMKDGYGAWFPNNIQVSSAARDFIAKLLTDPVSRMTAPEALEHPWLAQDIEYTLTRRVSEAPLGLNVLSNLQSFLACCKFKCTLLYVLAESLPGNELKLLQKTFQEMDENNDGFITVEELKHYVAAHPTMGQGEDPLDEVQHLLEMADVDGDGKLCYTELVMASVQKQLIAKEERLWQVFCDLDEDGDKSITIEELRGAIQRASFETPEEELKAMLEEIDVNHDGKINYEEFHDIFFAGHHAAIGEMDDRDERAKNKDKENA